MKKEEKFAKAIEHLNIAFSLLPQENDFQSIKVDIKKVVGKLENCIKKKLKRNDIQQTPLESWKDKISQWAANSSDPKKSIMALDKMLEDEKKKLINIQNQGKKEETLFG